MDFVKLESKLKVLADKTRLDIIKKISDGQHCGCDLIDTLDIKQPTLSHHLKVLSKVGLIVGKRHKKKVLYHINKAWIETLNNELEKLMDSNHICVVSE